MVGEIAHFIHDASPYPLVEGSIAAAIAYFAGIVGRAYNVSGSGLNQYCVLLAGTGAGKGAGGSAIGKLHKAVNRKLGEERRLRIGPALPASKQGLFHFLAGSGTNPAVPCCVSMMDEIGLFLQNVCNPKAYEPFIGIRQAMLTLFSASGGSNSIGESVYSDSSKNIKPLVAPAWSLFGNSTQVEFFKAFAQENFRDGLIGRLLLFEYPENQPNPKHKWGFEHIQPSAELVQRLVDLASHTKTIELTTNTDSCEWTNVPFDQTAAAFNHKIENENWQRIENYRINQELNLTALWKRYREKTFRLAALIAVGVNPYKPIITITEIKLAEETVRRGIEMLIRHLQAGDISDDNGNVDRHKELNKCLDKYMQSEWKKSYQVTQQEKQTGLIAHSYISSHLHHVAAFKKTPNPVASLETTINSFIDSGYIELAPASNSNKFQRTKKIYLIKTIKKRV